NLGVANMSKIAGNIVDPFGLAEKYGTDAVRYYLMSDIATGKDADFSEERLISSYNSDLANELGNLVNRTLNMSHRYRDGALRKINAAELPNNENQNELRHCEEREVEAGSNLYNKDI